MGLINIDSILNEPLKIARTLQMEIYVNIIKLLNPLFLAYLKQRSFIWADFSITFKFSKKFCLNL